MSTIRIRPVKPDDTAACHAVEVRCFPPREAATEAKIRRRQEQYPEGFLVADEDGRVAGFINSGATNEPDLAKEEFKDLVGHDPAGRSLVVLSLAVRPDRQGRGISRQLLEAFVNEARARGQSAILLLCKESLRPFYEKFGFVDSGLSAATHGGVEWREMRLEL